MTKGCEWLFPFELMTKVKTFVLHCQCKDDRDNWLRVFKIIQHMGSNTDLRDCLSPLEYEAKFMANPSEHQTGLQDGTVIKQTNYFQEFVVNNFPVYKSVNLVRERTSAVGTLVHKVRQASGMFIDNKYETMYVTLDFKTKMVKFSYD